MIQNLSMFSCLYFCLIIKQQQFTFYIMQSNQHSTHQNLTSFPFLALRSVHLHGTVRRYKLSRIVCCSSWSTEPFGNREVKNWRSSLGKPEKPIQLCLSCKCITWFFLKQNLGISIDINTCTLHFTLLSHKNN